MDQPLIARSSPGRWRLNPFRRPSRAPVDPSPEALADLLREHGVHRTAAKRLDSYHAAEAQWREARRAKQRLLLGAAGLVLSVTPAIPGAVKDCRADLQSWNCGLRVLALAGGALALATTVWSGWELWHHPNKLAQAAQRVSDAVARALHSRSGEAPVDDLFHRYRSMSGDERQRFAQHLHHYARQPKHGGITEALRRNLDPTLAV